MFFDFQPCPVCVYNKKGQGGGPCDLHPNTVALLTCNRPAGPTGGRRPNKAVEMLLLLLLQQLLLIFGRSQHPTAVS